jgi:Immunoglobulin domain/Immunoglobulin I-set domain
VDNRIAASLQVTWLRNEIPLEAAMSGAPRLQIGRDHSLTLSGLHKVDEAVYTCRAKTTFDQASASGRLTVLAEPPAFTSTARDIRVLEGRTTDLVCQASGVPAPRIQWSFGGKVLASRGGVLSLGALSPDREGEYVCTASNVYGAIDEAVSVQVIKGVRKETTQNLVPDIVKNIKARVCLVFCF